MKKYIADTNFVLRYLLADDHTSYDESKIIFAESRIGKSQIQIEESVFTEIIFVLSSFYKVPRIKIVSILKSLLSYKSIISNTEIYSTALDIYLEHNIHIVDSIIAAKSLINGDELLTFDKKLQNILKQKLNNINST